MNNRYSLFLALGLNALGGILFLRWLVQTDVMFGHFSGPASLAATSLALMGSGVLLGIIYFVRVGLGMARRVSKSSESPHAKRWIAANIVLALEMIPTTLFIFFVGAALAEELSQDMDRNRKASGYVYVERNPIPDDPEAVQALVDESIEVLASAEVEVEQRRLASARLRKIGSEAARAVPALQAALTDQDAAVRANSALALWKITGETALSESTFIEMLTQADPDGDEALYAIDGLQKLAPHSEAAMAALEETAGTHKDAGVRRQSEYALASAKRKLEMD